MSARRSHNGQHCMARRFSSTLDAPRLLLLQSGRAVLNQGKYPGQSGVLRKSGKDCDNFYTRCRASNPQGGWVLLSRSLKGSAVWQLSRATGRLPWSTSTPPMFSCEFAKSCCQPALREFELASRSARPDSSPLRQLALNVKHTTPLVRVTRKGQLRQALP